MKNGYPTARAVSSFTANCGHEVLAASDYIVKRPGLFYCSPSCAAADKSLEITIRLQDEGSLSELVYGVWGSLFWIRDRGDGTYSLHGAGVAREEIGEAFLRLILETAIEKEPLDDADAEKFPPTFHAEPTLEVEEWMERLRIRLGWGRPLDGQEMD